jgi:hypothetical protein
VPRVEPYTAQEKRRLRLMWHSYLIGVPVVAFLLWWQV